MTASQQLRVDFVEMVMTLLLSQFLPLFIGLAVRQWRPSLALRLKRPADVASTILNLCTLGFIVVARFEMLTAVRFRALVGMLALAGATVAAGWLLAQRGSENRKAMTFTTSVRNMAVALEIATSSFSGTPAVTAVLVYGLFQTLLMAAVALVYGHLDATGSSANEITTLQSRG
jgi:BASS family bile acid:Na+ symporter